MRTGTSMLPYRCGDDGHEWRQLASGLEVLNKYRPFNRWGARDPGTGGANGKVQRRLASTQFQVSQLQLHVWNTSTLLLSLLGIAVLVPENCTR